MILKPCLNFKSIMKFLYIASHFNSVINNIYFNRYFNQVEIDEMTISIAKYEDTIEKLSCYASEGCGNIPWPVGAPPPFKPPTRFDVLRWDYFNETHIFLKTDHDVLTLMTSMNSFSS